MARPTDYNEEIQAKADTYLEHVEENGEIPSAASLAQFLGTSKKTLYNWAERYPEFLHTLAHVNTAQEIMLVNKGLKNEFNSTITKLMMSNHGYSDKQDITSGGDRLPSPILGGTSVQREEEPES